jgi:hypothetical protein
LTIEAVFAIYVNVINIDMSRTEEEQAAMYAVVTRIDDFGRPAWIALMVLGFIVFWPIGLAILAYMLWSGRMGCGRTGDLDQWRERAAARWERKRERWERKMQHWAGHHWTGHRGHGLRPSGNYAFDEYREEALRRLEEEATEFRAFLERLRAAKDRAEFDEFMRDRRNRPSGSGSPQDPEPRPQT